MEQNLFRVGGVYRDRSGRVLKITGEVGSVSDPFFQRSKAVAVSAICADGSEYETGWRRLEDGKYHGNHQSVDLLPGELHQVDGQWVPVEESDSHCVCRDHTAPGIVHRVDGPCYHEERVDPNAAMIASDGPRNVPLKPPVRLTVRTVSTAHPAIDGLTRCNDLGVRVLGARG